MLKLLNKIDGFPPLQIAFSFIRNSDILCLVAKYAPFHSEVYIRRGGAFFSSKAEKRKWKGELIMDLFEKEYKKWMDSHISKRKGERRRKLEAGSNHAEKEMLRHIWWAAFGNFDYLHPEYEITDFFQGQRFLDFVFIRGPIKIVFEIDGYGPHLRDISRRQFCDQWVRQMHLTNDNWIVVRIGYDDVKERPRLWISLIQQMMGRL
jgi:hypothetical protein